MTSTRNPAPVELHLGRSAVYEFLANAYGYPGEQRATRLRELADELRELPGDLLPSGLLEPAIQLVTLPVSTLRLDYARVFTHTVSPDCPSYETAYSARDIFQQAQAMADIAGFYRAHGLKVGGQDRERPDHIATELEFMGFMALKQAYALEHLGPEPAEMCEETQRLFLRDHLGRWAGSLGTRTALTATREPFYNAAGRLLAGWMEAECARMETGPIAPLDEPVVPLPEPDDGACGADADSCPLISLDDIPVEGVQQ